MSKSQQPFSAQLHCSCGLVSQPLTQLVEACQSNGTLACEQELEPHSTLDSLMLQQTHESGTVQQLMAF